jgi:hypothetical protein
MKETSLPSAERVTTATNTCYHRGVCLGGGVVVGDGKSFCCNGCLAVYELLTENGLGTVPMMLSIGLVGKLFRLGTRLRFQKLIPATPALVGFLLILRRMSLGIPYPRPVLTNHGVSCPACHQ